MTQEEKARAYDEAIKKAAALYKAAEPMSGCNVIIETLFPELSESEDEKIRKVLLNDSKNNCSEYYCEGVNRDMIIAWLEKQGEQKASYTTIAKTGDGGINALVTRDIEIPFCAKDSELQEATYYIPKGYYAEIEGDKVTIKKGEQKPFDYENANIQQKDFAPKVEPKFHEGEWLCENEPNNYARFIQILEIINIQGKERYRISRDIHNDENIVEFDFVEKYYHRFDIKDARVGDVFYINNTVSESIMIYKSFNNGVINKYASYNKFGFEDENYLTLNDGYIIPATKEQHDLLFEKMKEAGYEWYAENKQLNKTYIVHDTYCQDNCKGFQETGKCFTDGDCKAKEEAEQKLAENEDEKIRKGLIEILSKCKYFYSKKIAWLKKQDKSSDEDMKTLLRTEYEKGRADAIAEMQGEWSEKDKDFMYGTLSNLTELKDRYGEGYCNVGKCIDWLKSLRPQSRWKPSDKHIRFLQAMVNDPNNASSESCQIVLKDILEKLKKLKEE